MQAAFLYDPMFLNHRCQYEHPERPERLASVINGLKQAGVWDDGIQITPRPASDEELQLVHTKQYVDDVIGAMTRSEFGNLDPDTFFSPGSLEAALNAAGGGVDLALAVHRKQADWGFAVVRPPGHHATWRRACGFCIFNSISVAAATLVASGEAKRVAIVDWDVHHGNGTQDQFWNDPNVLYISMHQWPFFPGSGLVEDVGGPDAPGKTVNLPFPPHASDEDYIIAMDKVILPVLDAFRPDHLLISAGFDAHKQDMLASMLLTSDCYAEMAFRLKDAADRLCHGRLTVFLEGGYDLKALEDSTQAMVRGIQKAIHPSASKNIPLTGPHLTRIKEVTEQLSPYWPKIFSD
jgi:acetoin utilization deacetylase AcuC-like enzyme